MEQYKLFELTFTGETPNGSQAVIDLDAVFTWVSEDGKKENKSVKGFYAGEGNYIVRFLPEMPGTYSWKVKGCITAEGSEECTGKNNRHGIIRANGNHFEFSDKSIFLPVGTTIYALAHQEKTLIATTLETLKTAPFNKVRHCVFPKDYVYNHNEPELFAFEKNAEGKWDVNRPCYSFWEHLEQVIFSLADMGIQSDVILFHPYDKWGFAHFSIEECKIYLDYLLRRFSAIPDVWWSMANEYDLMQSKSIQDWYEIEEFIAKNDSFHHLLSNHNGHVFYDFTRPAITHCCVQSGQVELAAKWLEKYKKPLVYDECCYEGNIRHCFGNISGFEMVNRFWIACVQGAYATHGETFLSDDEVLWWSKGGVLKGESPKRIAFLKDILQELPVPVEPWPGDPPEGSICGCCGNQVFLLYLARHCNGIVTWILPTDLTYRIDVIDVWEMTRKTVLTDINGTVDITLPGKEGIAVIATANQGKA